MATENEPDTPPETPPADPPETPPANPPQTTDESLHRMVEELSGRVEALALEVQTLATGDTTPDATPVSIPWTARGRR